MRPTPAAVPLTGRKRHKSSRLRARSREAEKGRRLRHRVRDVGRGGQGHARLVDRAMDHHPPPELVASERGDRRQVAHYSIPCSAWKLARLHTANLGAFYAAMGPGAAEGEAAAARGVDGPTGALGRRATLAQGVCGAGCGRTPPARASPGPGRRRSSGRRRRRRCSPCSSGAEQDDPSFTVFLVLAAVTGARGGEPLLLRWTDLDLELDLTVLSSLRSAPGRSRRWSPSSPELSPAPC